MSWPEQQGGRHMAAEIAEAPGVFVRAAGVDCRDAALALGLDRKHAFYTIARGSSDAAANILSYEFMRQLGLPMTSLPPSVFSLGQGVSMRDAAAVVVSQSGASDDLVRSARGIRLRGGAVVAITNVTGSAVEAEAGLTLAIGAGPEHAVPATKTVIGSVGAGIALLAALNPDCQPLLEQAVDAFAGMRGVSHPEAARLQNALVSAQHVYVIGRDSGFGAAHEVALKIKETCAIHAEAYSSSEVLHGPLQLVTKPLTILMLDTGQPETQDSLDTAERRFRAAGGQVFRICPSDVGVGPLMPAAAAALLLYLVYPVILSVAVALGLDPDAPETLSKVTQTR